MSPAEMLEQLKLRAKSEGFDEVLERKWGPNTAADTHTHEFDADAVVTEGEMWLTCEGATKHLLPGGTFLLPAGLPHSERYGPQGAIYWVARRNHR